MPKVTTETVWPVPGQPGIKVIFNVNSEGKFSFQVPEVLRVVHSDARSPLFNQIGEAATCLDDLVKKFQLSKTSSSFVIGYRFSICGNGREDFNFYRGRAVGVCCLVYCEKKTETEKGAFYDYEVAGADELGIERLPFRPEGCRVSSDGPLDWVRHLSHRPPNLVPYTPENVTFFCRILDGMQRLAEEFEKLRNPDTLPDAIAKGSFLALQPRKPSPKRVR